MAKSLTWGHKTLSFMPLAVLCIYLGPDLLRPINKLSLRPNDTNVTYQPPDTYEYQYQMPQYYDITMKHMITS